MKTILAALSLALVSCATGYGPSGLTGGYSELQLNERTYRVSFNGNGYTSSESAGAGALRRAAELTLQHGFTHLIVTNGATDVSRSLHTTPVSCTTIGSNVSCSGGDTYAVEKPNSSLIFHMLTWQEAASDLESEAIDAQGILVQYGAISPAFITVNQTPDRQVAAVEELRDILRTAWSDDSAVHLSDAFASGYSAGTADGVDRRNAILYGARQIACEKAHTEMIKDASDDKQVNAIADEGGKCTSDWGRHFAAAGPVGPRYAVVLQKVHDAAGVVGPRRAAWAFDRGYRIAVNLQSPSDRWLASEARIGCMNAANSWTTRLGKRTADEVCAAVATVQANPFVRTPTPPTR